MWLLALAPAHAQFVQQGNKLDGSGASAGGAGQGTSAALSADGNTAVFGGPTDDPLGAVWVFTRSSGMWNQQGTKLVGGNSAGQPFQGTSVAISGDGNTIIVGGPGDNNQVGAAWIFTLTDGAWTQQGGKLVASDSAATPQYGVQQGQSVAISADGNTVFVGGPNDNSLAGAAWIFTRSGTVWTQQGSKLVGTGGSGGLAGQGFSVAMSGDGTTAIIGGPNDGAGSGAAWVFTRSGSVWTQQGGKLTGSGTSGLNALFGRSAAISADGNTAILGGSGLNDSAGAAWVFSRSQTTWRQQAGPLSGTGATGVAGQGWSVALSGDASTAMIGGPTDSIGSGAVWAFTNAGGVWSQLGNKLSGSGGAGLPEQGTSVALSGDGSTALIGGPYDGADDTTGAVWVFTRPATAAPSLVSLVPAVSSGSSQVFTFAFNAPDGYQTLDVLNVLINVDLDGRQACYLAYSVPTNTLYIVPDSGDATQLTGAPVTGTGTLSNSQCSVNLNGTTASGNGDTFTLALNLSFTTSFAGNKVVYAAARDQAQNNSGWQTMGVHGVPPLPSTFPNPVGMSPSSGNTASATITVSYQDQTSAADLQTVWALINTAIDGRAACYVAYYRPGNLLYLYPDSGDGNAATNIVLTGNNTISNSQCTVYAQGSQVVSNGQTLSVTLPITFQTSFAGFKGVWMAAQTMGGAQTSPWQALGAWVVP